MQNITAMDKSVTLFDIYKFILKTDKIQHKRYIVFFHRCALFARIECIVWGKLLHVG